MCVSVHSYICPYVHGHAFCDVIHSFMQSIRLSIWGKRGMGVQPMWGPCGVFKWVFKYSVALLVSFGLWKF